MFERTSRATTLAADLLKPKLVSSRRGLIRAAAQYPHGGQLRARFVNGQQHVFPARE